MPLSALMCHSGYVLACSSCIHLLCAAAVNVASRMESTGVPGKIHVSAAFAALLPSEQWEATGGLDVKGKGVMETYLTG